MGSVEHWGRKGVVVEGGCCSPQQSTVPNAAARAPSVPITGEWWHRRDVPGALLHPWATAASRARGSPVGDSVAVLAQWDTADPEPRRGSPTKPGSRRCHPFGRHSAAPTALGRDLHTKEPPVE